MKEDENHLIAPLEQTEISQKGAEDFVMSECIATKHF
jgi:hypothetical protein